METGSEKSAEVVVTRESEGSNEEESESTVSVSEHPDRERDPGSRTDRMMGTRREEAERHRCRELVRAGRDAVGRATEETERSTELADKKAARSEFWTARSSPRSAVRERDKTDTDEAGAQVLDEQNSGGGGSAADEVRLLWGGEQPAGAQSRRGRARRTNTATARSDGGGRTARGA